MGKKGKSKYSGKFYLGQKFSKWEVISENIILDGEAKVEVKCECNAVHIVSAYTLIKGTSKQCLECGNSLKGEKNPIWKGYKDIPYSWFSKYFERKGRSKRTGDITIKDVYDMWLKQEKKCALSGVYIDFKYDKINGVSASIDRIDSNNEYTINNIQLVHKDVNLMKNSFKQDYFIIMCDKITKYAIKK